MNRSIGISVLSFAAALALLAVAGVHAVFDDSQTATGSVNAAGAVDLRLGDVSLPCGVTDISEDEITFEEIENLVPGDAVTCEVSLKNQGSTPFDVNVTGADTSLSLLDICDSPADDFTIDVVKGADTDGDDTLGSTARIDPGVTDTAFITVTFDIGASNACEGIAAFVSVRFTAVQAP